VVSSLADSSSAEWGWTGEKHIPHSGGCVKFLYRIVFLLCPLQLLLCPAIFSQLPIPKVAPTAAAPAAVPAEPSKDTLGRISPRGAVLSFLSAARKGNDAIAALYLNTSLRGEDAENLAHQLAVVLDRRLPARLNEISDAPEGSLADPLKPDEDIVGTIATANGDLDIVVERIDRGKAGRVWLFSKKTLNSIPNVFQEVNTPAIEQVLPKFLVNTQVASFPLFEWLAVFLGIPFLYLLTVVLNRLLSRLYNALRQKLLPSASEQNTQVLPPPIRLFLLALTIHWLLSRIGLPLLARQFWSNVALFIAIAASVWLLMLCTRWSEHYLLRRRGSRELSGAASILRLVRRAADGLFLFAGLLFILYHFGVDPTAALAGLGVGGIAVALAAQKTLENVIGGISLIADQAVRVGDTLKVSDILGTVEDVGLRSTRIRTLDRSIVSLPNGQIANMNLENLSTRDTYWFHPVLCLRYETTSVQLSSAMAAIRKLIGEHSAVEPLSARVRFVRFGAFSLEVEVFAYVFAADWSDFLNIQEELLLNLMDIVRKAGTEFALPSQTMYLAADSSDMAGPLILDQRAHSTDTLHPKATQISKGSREI
jgi:MscS family membrane protein